MDKRNSKKKTVGDTVCEIHKFSGYAVLSNCFVRSTKLGCPAIGLLGRVMDLPPTWNFSKAGLIALCPDGETAVDSALNPVILFSFFIRPSAKWKSFDRCINQIRPGKDGKKAQ